MALRVLQSKRLYAGAPAASGARSALTLSRVGEEA